MESTKNEYFIDGFLIRHFNIFPDGFEKDNLFPEQKIFLIWLMGQIPDLDIWKRNVEYKTKLAEIQSLDKVELNQTEIDLAVINEKPIKQVEREQLFNEKKRLVQELNKKFGIEEDEKEIEKTVDIKSDVNDNNPKRIWDLLTGKGLVK